MDLFDLFYHLSHSPWWMGWPAIIVGAFALGVVVGRWLD
jgi:hypothetical protein